MPRRRARIVYRAFQPESGPLGRPLRFIYFDISRIIVAKVCVDVDNRNKGEIPTKSLNYHEVHNLPVSLASTSALAQFSTDKDKQ